MIRKLTEKPIRIVYVITGCSTGGAEMMLLKVLKMIDRGKFSPHVFSLTGVGEIGPRIAALGIPVEALGMRRGVPDPIRFVRLVRRLHQIKPDIVHTWMYHADFVGGIASWLVRVPTVIWGVHSSDILTYKNSVTTKLIVLCCAKILSWLPDCVQYVSPYAKTYHESLGYRKSCSVVIPNGVDLKEFTPNEKALQEVRQEIGISSKTPMIGFVGRFDPVKNIEGFVKAAGHLHHDMPGVHFLMIGESLEWSNKFIKKIIEDNKLTSVFHLLGRRDDIPRIMASLDLVCLTSWCEAFGIVLIEAMACCVPCVSTDCGDQGAILGNTGWLVPIGDMEGIAKKCRAFLSLPENERRLIGEAARARVMDIFELGAVVKQYEVMYLGFAKQELCKKRDEGDKIKRCVV